MSARRTHVKPSAQSVPLFGAGLLCALVSAYYASHSPVNDDDVSHLHSIWLVAHGMVPYRQFFENHPPGLWVLFSPVALIFQTPSAYLLAGRFTIAALWGLTIWLAGEMIEARGLQVAALTLAGISIALHCQVWMFRVEYVGSFLLILHLFLLLRIEKAPHRITLSLFAAAALATGCAMTVRLLMFTALQPALVLLRYRHDWKRQLSSWFAGVCLGLLPTVLYLSFHHLWGDMRFWAFRFVSSPGIVYWSPGLTPEEIGFMSAGLAAVLLCLSTTPLPAYKLLTLAAAWLCACAFEVLNPAKTMPYWQIHLYLMTALFFGLGVSLIWIRQPIRVRGFAILISLLLAISYVTEIRWDRRPDRRPMLTTELRVMDWLKEVAGGEAVVLVDPLHPMMASDATYLHNAWQYSFWLGNPYVRRRLTYFAGALLRHPPPVIANNPWIHHTGGKTFLEWLQYKGIMNDQESAQVKTLLHRRYMKVKFPQLMRDGHPQFGDEFWVRTDRFQLYPPPHPYRIINMSKV